MKIHHIHKILLTYVLCSSSFSAWGMEEGDVLVEVAHPPHLAPKKLSLNLATVRRGDTLRVQSADRQLGGENSSEDGQVMAPESPPSGKYLASPRLSSVPPATSRSHRGPTRSFLGVKKGPGHHTNSNESVQFNPGHFTPREAERDKSNSPQKVTQRELNQIKFNEGASALEEALNNIEHGNDADIKQGFIRAIDAFELAERDGYPKAAEQLGFAEACLGHFLLPIALKENPDIQSIGDLKKEAFDVNALQDPLRYLRLSWKRGDERGTRWYAKISFMVGELYLGRGNKEKAQEHFLIAANLHHHGAQKSLAGLLTNVSDQIKWLRRSAKGRNVLAMYTLGQMLFEESSLTYEAIYWLKKANAEDPNVEITAAMREAFDQIESHFNTGVGLLRQQKFDDAVGLLEAASSMGHAEASFDLIRCYEALGQHDKVIALYGRLAERGEEEAQCQYATAIAPKPPEAGKKLTKDEETLLKKAEKLYEEAIASDHLLAFFDYGDLLFQYERYEEAERLFKELTLRVRSFALDGYEFMFEQRAKSGEDTSTWKAGLTALEGPSWFVFLGKKDQEAEEWLAKELEDIKATDGIPHTHFKYLFDKIRFSARKKNLLDTEKYLRMLLVELKKLGGQAFRNLGTICEEQEHPFKALTHFYAAAAFNDPWGCYHYARYLENEGDPEQAKEYYERAANYGVFEAALNRAFMAKGEKDENAAILWFIKAKKLNRYHPQVLINLGLLLEEKKPKKAEKYFQEAAEFEDTKALSLLGDLYIQRGRVAEARELYKQAYKLGRGSAAFKLALLAEKDSFEKVLKWTARAAKLDYHLAQFRLGQYLEKQGYIDLAIQWYQKAKNRNIEAKKRLAVLWVISPGTDYKTEGLNTLQSMVKEPSGKKDKDVHYALGFHTLSYFMCREDIQEGIKYCQRAIELGSKDAFSYLFRYTKKMEKPIGNDKNVVIQFNGKHREEALAVYRFLMEKGPEKFEKLRTEVRFAYGRLMYELGQPQQGLKYIREAASQRNQEARQFLNALESQQQ